jgi:hypothetical protein
VGYPCASQSTPSSLRASIDATSLHNAVGGGSLVGVDSASGNLPSGRSRFNMRVGTSQLLLWWCEVSSNWPCMEVVSTLFSVLAPHHFLLHKCLYWGEVKTIALKIFPSDFTPCFLRFPCANPNRFLLAHRHYEVSPLLAGAHLRHHVTISYTVAVCEMSLQRSVFDLFFDQLR